MSRCHAATPTSALSWIILRASDSAVRLPVEECSYRGRRRYMLRVLGLAVINTVDMTLCLEALERAKAYARRVPEILNTDQVSQFICLPWCERLAQWSVRISMDDKGRWMNNVFTERLWRSLKYEDIYLRPFPCSPQLKMRGKTPEQPLPKNENTPAPSMTPIA